MNCNENKTYNMLLNDELPHCTISANKHFGYNISNNINNNNNNNNNCTNDAKGHWLGLDPLMECQNNICQR